MQIFWNLDIWTKPVAYSSTIVKFFLKFHVNTEFEKVLADYSDVFTNEHIATHRISQIHAKMRDNLIPVSDHFKSITSLVCGWLKKGQLLIVHSIVERVCCSCIFVLMSHKKANTYAKVIEIIQRLGKSRGVNIFNRREYASKQTLKCLHLKLLLMRSLYKSLMGVYFIIQIVF